MTDNNQNDKLLVDWINTTGRVSENTRWLAVGFIAMYFAFLKDVNPHLDKTKFEFAVFFVGLSGILTLLFDFLQYVFKSRNIVSTRLARIAEVISKDEYKKDSWYWLSRISYFSKLIFLTTGGIAILSAFIIHNWEYFHWLFPILFPE